jgi:hypothetical protein
MRDYTAAPARCESTTVPTLTFGVRPLSAGRFGSGPAPALQPAWCTVLKDTVALGHPRPPT